MTTFFFLYIPLNILPPAYYSSRCAPTRPSISFTFEDQNIRAKNSKCDHTQIENFT